LDILERRCWAFAVAVLAYNVLAILKRGVEQAHDAADGESVAPPLDVSTYYLAQDIHSHYEGMMIAIPSTGWSSWADAEPAQIAQRLLELGRCVEPRRVSTHKRGPKTRKPKSYVDGVIARAHHSAARQLKQARAQRP
jgi:hypothetical protein